MAKRCFFVEMFGYMFGLWWMVGWCLFLFCFLRGFNGFVVRFSVFGAVQMC